MEIELMRHSAAHVMAAAIQRLFPEAKFGVGPTVDFGFYYDVEIGRTVTPEDLVAIQAEMKKIVEENEAFVRKEMSIDEAISLFEGLKQQFKVELLRDLKEKGTTKISDEEAKDIDPAKRDVASVYTLGGFTDLCRGPHVETANQIGAIELNKIAGAYWRGNENNPQLQRIYGLCFTTQEELDNHKALLLEAEKRDHRKLGKELDLFHIDEMVGLGLPLWHPKGAILWRAIEDFWYAEHLKNGYDLVRTPHIGKQALWETSGHWGFYNDSMYPPLEVGKSLKDEQDEKEVAVSERYLLKPMNCPFHVQIYKNGMHSYRDLPMRWAECGTVYRFEKKGELSGLTRVRGFTQDDAHIICRADQVEDELKKVVDFTLFMFKSFGFDIKDIHVYLSVRDPNAEKSIGSDEGWRFTEEVLEKVANDKKLNISKDIGGAAFYGPKLDFKIKDCLGREWQCSTLQFDFNLPERFKMTYINAEGAEEQPYMLHRALFGSFERFIGLLIEHYGGAFPTWIAPVQVMILPVADRHAEPALGLADELTKKGFRAEVDTASESVGKKIRNAEMKKVPYMIVFGDKEMEGNLTIRKRGVKDQYGLVKDEFIEVLLKEVKDHLT
ncbi:MAG: threonine--tRNA ligase [Patescibacteria group bacterium]|nr:threonine--tRNA ligase [Patescibacteria group bacterium]